MTQLCVWVSQYFAFQKFRGLESKKISILKAIFSLAQFILSADWDKSSWTTAKRHWIQWGLFVLENAVSARLQCQYASNWLPHRIKPLQFYLWVSWWSYKRVFFLSQNIFSWVQQLTGTKKMSNKNNKPLVTVTVTNCTTRKLMLFLLFSQCCSTWGWVFGVLHNYFHRRNYHFRGPSFLAEKVFLYEFVCHRHCIVWVKYCISLDAVCSENCTDQK